MKNIDRAFLDDLLSRIDIIEIINDKVKLKQYGSNYKGLCPFHAENTPSFNVSKSKQFYHCFGCGASGDAIKFLKEYEGLTFMEAVEKLSTIANIKIPETSGSKYQNYDQFFQINSFALSIFKVNLQKNQTALNYLESRNISKNEIGFFDIGFANDSWDFMFKELKEKGFVKEAIEIGLLTEKNNKIYDRFRNRIIFPIKNSTGRTIAFGGRSLNSEEPSKYINSPESKLFHKSFEVYGLFEAKQTINRAEKVIIVEGYTDVIALHINGFKNVVATLGTAFTKTHLSKLLRYTKNIIFCFDGDKAGKNAAWKALTNSLSEIRDDIKIEFAFLPDGKDPDQLCQESGKDSFEKMLSSSIPLSEFMFENFKENLDLSKVENKSKFISMTKPLIKQIPKGVFSTLMQEKLSSFVSIPRNELFGFQENQQKDPQENTKMSIDSSSSDSYILPILLEYPLLLNSFEEKICRIIKNGLAKKIVGVIKDLNKKHSNVNASMIIEHLPEDRDLIEKYLEKEIVDKDENSASNTLDLILSSLEKDINEEQYFSILKKFSDGDKLTNEEKEILKNFKK
ncbi:MAG: DNA primase [Pseudomonadota bacterium]|nr:DNA primase [Pseudomonadota bacterium]